MLVDLILSLLVGAVNFIFLALHPFVAIGTTLSVAVTFIYAGTKVFWYLPFMYVFAPTFAVVTSTELAIIVFYSAKQVLNFFRGSGA